MRKRGVTDFSLTMVDPWASSWTGPEDDPPARRIARPLTWRALGAGRERLRPAGRGPDRAGRPRRGRGRRGHRPRRRAVPAQRRATTRSRGSSRPGNVPAVERLPRRRQADRDHPARGPELHRRRARRLAGRSGTLRIGFTPREGLVLHQVGYAGRPIVHRASLAEMYVPYGDPAPTHRFKNVFDQGEYGVGWLANSLTLGCDCVGHIQYFDGVVNDNDGGSVVIPNAVCMHEEDAGIGVEAHRLPHRAMQVRRRRRLVISSDRHRGQLRVRLLLVPLHRRHDRVRGQAHRRHLHRRDRAGRDAASTARWSRPASTARTTSTSSACGWTWPSTARRTRWSRSTRCPARPGRTTRTATRGRPAAPCWRSEAAARRDIDAARARYWKIESAERKSALGAPTAYALMPGSNVPPMYSPDALYAPRAGFTEHQLWVTAYDPTQRFAAGDYPNQHPGGQGLPDLRRRATGRWRAPTSWSGTRSAPTTSCARRTGR